MNIVQFDCSSSNILQKDGMGIFNSPLFSIIFKPFFNFIGSSKQWNESSWSFEWLSESDLSSFCYQWDCVSHQYSQEYCYSRCTNFSFLPFWYGLLAIEYSVIIMIMICLDTLYESFHSLPPHIQSDDHLATIVPAFEYKEQTELNITSFQDIVLKYF